GGESRVVGAAPRVIAAARPSSAGSAAATRATAAASGFFVPRSAFAPRCGGWRSHFRQIHSFDRCARNLMTNVAFDVGQSDGVFLAAEADGIALCAGARR